MAIREKLRKVMSRSNENGSNSSRTSSSGPSRKNSNVYQPGEVIPYKYRRPVQKEHKEKLEAFSFANAWRRKSHTSQYSPMGSRAVSRRNSVASQLRRGFAKRHQGSVGSVHAKDEAAAAKPDAATAERSESAGENIEPRVTDFVSKGKDRPMDSPQHDQPFSQEELTLALKKSHLAVPA